MTIQQTISRLRNTEAKLDAIVDFYNRREDWLKETEKFKPKIRTQLSELVRIDQNSILIEFGELANGWL